MAIATLEKGKKMSRYIDAEELKSAIRKAFPNLMMRVDINSIINEQPTADVVEHGEWIKFDEGDCYCSNCGIALEDWVQGIFYKFCPNCGANMRGEQHD